MLPDTTGTIEPWLYKLSIAAALSLTTNFVVGGLLTLSLLSGLACLASLTLRALELRSYSGRR